MDLKEHLQNNKYQRIDELLATLGALATIFVVTVCIKSIVDTDFIKGLGSGMKDALDKLPESTDSLKGKMRSWKTKNKKDSDKEDTDEEDEEDARAAAAAMAMADMADEAINNEEDVDKKSKCTKLLAGFRSATTDDGGNLLPPANWSERFKDVNGFDAKDAGETVDLELDEDGVFKEKKSLLKNMGDWFDKKGDKGMNEEVEKNKSLSQAFAPKMKQLMAHNDSPEEDLIEINSAKKEAGIKRNWLAKIETVDDPDIKADFEKEMENDIEKNNKEKNSLLKKLLNPDKGKDDKKEIADVIDVDYEEIPDDEERNNDKNNDKKSGEGKKSIFHKILKGKRGGKYYKTKNGDKVYVESINDESSLYNYLNKKS